MNLLSLINEQYIGSKPEESLVLLDRRCLPLSGGEFVSLALCELHYYTIFDDPEEGLSDLTIYYELKGRELISGVYSLRRRKKLSTVKVLTLPEPCERIQRFFSKKGCTFRNNSLY